MGAGVEQYIYCMTAVAGRGGERVKGLHLVLT